MPSVYRTCVVLDYQNMHLTAHGLYDSTRHGPKHECLLDPLAFGANLIAARNASQRPGYPAAQLAAVEVYRGLPSSRHSPRDYARSQAQKSQWERDARVSVHLRPLQYRPRYDNAGNKVLDQDGNEIIDEVREKGVDVLCALAVVRAAASPDIDLVVLASHDTDLEPALDEGLKFPGMRIETCQWYRTGRYTKQLKPTSRSVWNTRLNEQDFMRSWDLTNYP